MKCSTCSNRFILSFFIGSRGGDYLDEKSSD
jgi:hypothetical protein